jgi:hypothetical protein
MITPSDTSNGGFVVIAKYRDDGVYQWSTICKTNSKKVEGAFIKIDSSNTIYTGFEYVDPAQIESKENVVVDVFQRSGRSPITATSFTPSISNHIIRGQLSFIGIVAFNPDGKVLFTSKIDGGGGERITALDVFDIDGRYDIVVGMTSSGEQFNCFDMSGISFRFVSGLTKDLSDSRPSAFIVGLPTFHFYLIDPAPSGAVHKVINVSQQRGFVIPYYEKENVEQTFTNGIFSVPERSAVELTFIKGGSGDNEGTWFAAKDPDAGLIVIDKVNGGVGIGTTDPLELLHVEGSAFLKGDLRVAGRIVNPLINFGLDGEIGIGVTGDPKGYLHINKDTGTGVDFRPSILLQSPGNGEFSGSLDFRDNIDAGFRFQHRTGGNLTVDLLRSGASVASPPMLTFTHGVGAGQSITDSNARIGIGTDEPEAKLHVEGSMVVKSGLPNRQDGNTDFVKSRISVSDTVANTFEISECLSFQTTPITSDHNRALRSVVWAKELGLFVAVGTARTRQITVVGGATITSYSVGATSPDGISWREASYQLIASLHSEWREVCWSPQRLLFVAVSSSAVGGSSQNSRLATSTDGDSWTDRSVTQSLNCVCWSPERNLFVAMGPATFTSPNYIFGVLSSDGTDWLGIASTDASFAGSNWVSVTWAAELGLFVAVSDTGTGNRVATSPDGIIWTRRTSAGDRTWRSVTWSPELRLLVAVGSNFVTNPVSRFMTSSDGITWNAPFTSLLGRAWQSVVWSRELGLFIAVANAGGAGDRIMTSPDGINWSSRTSPADNQWFSVTWSPELGRAVAVAFSGTNRGMYSRQLQRFASRIEGSQEVSEDMIVKRNINIGQAIMPTPVGDAPLYSVRAWVQFNGQTTVPTINVVGNIKSVTRIDNGVYDISFTIPMPSRFYSVFVGTAANNSGLRDEDYSTKNPTGVNPTESGFRIVTTAGSTTDFRNWVHVSIIVVR